MEMLNSLFKVTELGGNNIRLGDWEPLIYSPYEEVDFFLT